MYRSCQNFLGGTHVHYKCLELDAFAENCYTSKSKESWYAWVDQ